MSDNPPKPRVEVLRALADQYFADAEKITQKASKVLLAPTPSTMPRLKQTLSEEDERTLERLREDYIVVRCKISAILSLIEESEEE